MTGQWLRRASLTVSGGSEALDLSEMRFRFDIRRADTSAPNSADIRIYNLHPETVSRLLQSRGQTVTVQAGYLGAQFGAIYLGPIIQARRGRESPVDTYVDLTCADGDGAHQFAFISTSLNAGATVRDQIRAIAKKMADYSVGFDESSFPDSLPDRPLPRGKTLHGLARDLLNQLSESEGFAWSIQGGKLQITMNGEALPGAAIVLTSETGMIGLPEQTPGGVMARCLINPEIVPGRAIRIDNRSVQMARLGPEYGALPQFERNIPALATDGIYMAYSVDYRGDTRGQEWYQIMALVDPAAIPPGILQVIPPSVLWEQWRRSIEGG
jgi:hypothetical protein